MSTTVNISTFGVDSIDPNKYVGTTIAIEFTDYEDGAETITLSEADVEALIAFLDGRGLIRAAGTVRAFVRLPRTEIDLGP